MITYHEVHHDFKHTTYKDKEADNTDKKWTRVMLVFITEQNELCMCVFQ